MAKNSKRPAKKPVKRSSLKAAKPVRKAARPVRAKATPRLAVRVKKAADPRRIGVRAMAIQSKPDGQPKGKKTVPAAAKSGPTGMPRIGELAPDFVLPDAGGHSFQLSKLRGSPVVLYFYPKDDTPGCTLEALDFSRDYPEFKKKGIVILGVSKDTPESHGTFIQKYKLTIPLLSDPETKVIKRYGCWVEKNMYGKKMMGTQRATFVIAADGYIMKVFPNVTPEGHSKEILKLFT